MKALVAALERIATALEQLVPALTQATRETRQDRINIVADVERLRTEFDTAYRITREVFGEKVPPDEH